MTSLWLGATGGWRRSQKREKLPATDGIKRLLPSNEDEIMSWKKKSHSDVHTHRKQSRYYTRTLGVTEFLAIVRGTALSLLQTHRYWLIYIFFRHADE